MQGGQVLTRVQIDSVTGQHPKVYLRLMLVEDTVLLTGDGIDWRALTGLNAKNQYDVEQPMRQLHYNVVRAVAHRPPVRWGLPLQVPGTVQYTFDVAAIQRRHLEYYRGGVKAIVDSIPRDNKWLIGNGSHDVFASQLPRFPDEHDWRMNPKRLHVVAYVQDAQTGEILQAAMVPVNDWSEW